MKTLAYCCCIFLTFHCWGGEMKKECETPTPKILVLVSTSFGSPLYEGFYREWLTYRDYDPEHVNVYLYKVIQR